jgi:hypothetical protein
MLSGTDNDYLEEGLIKVSTCIWADVVALHPCTPRLSLPLNIYLGSRTVLRFTSLLMFP